MVEKVNTSGQIECTGPDCPLCKAGNVAKKRKRLKDIFDDASVGQMWVVDNSTAILTAVQRLQSLAGAKPAAAVKAKTPELAVRAPRKFREEE